MSNINETASCPFAGHGEDLVNVKFFRGTRDDIITPDELFAQAEEAHMQQRLGAAIVSKAAPVSAHPSTNVRDFVASI